MAIPPMKDILLPLLRFSAAEGGEVAVKRAIAAMADLFELNEKQRKERTSGGKTKRIDSRVGWAKHKLQSAGLVEFRGKGLFAITEEGRTLAKNPPKDFRAHLNALIARRKEEQEGTDDEPRDAADAASEDEETDEPDVSPREQIDAAFESLQEALEVEVINRVLTLNPESFEILVLKLLVKLGHGDSFVHTGGAGDHGIDGIVNRDHLGFGRVAMQAKLRQKETRISPREVRDFSGSMHARGITEGVFATTSTFSREARVAAEEARPNRIILIDGRRLVGLMKRAELGVRVSASYDLHAVDENFFSED